MKFLKKLTFGNWFIVLLILGGGAGAAWYFDVFGSSDNSAVASYVVEEIKTGTVSSGIETTGVIEATQKLDLNVYKQRSRISVVNTKSGAEVKAGDVLVSFDKSDVLVDVASTEVAINESVLAVQEANTTFADPNTEARTLQNEIAILEESISEANLDIKNAYEDYLNKDLSVEPKENSTDQLLAKNRPTLSGRYSGAVAGVYKIYIYRPGAESGFSFRVSGLENYTDSVYFNNASDLGKNGLSIKFSEDIQSGDEWQVAIPNTFEASYSQNQEDYDRAVADLKEKIRGYEVDIKNKDQRLAELRRTDAVPYRNLNIEKAELGLKQNRQQLIEYYDVVKERDIVAPFAGSIEGMANVVVGATPTGDTSDPIKLGTLISDKFLTSFNLGAADAAKVKIGQAVKVTITSFSEKPEFEATITEISSLPNNSGVAQYEVQALLDYDKSSPTLALREGMLTDILIVEEEKSDVLRVPTAALTYSEGVPSLMVIDILTDDQKLQFETTGVVAAEAGGILGRKVNVVVGVRGRYYTEIKEGITAGQWVITTATDPTAVDSVVEQAGFGPPRDSEPSESNSPRD